MTKFKFHSLLTFINFDDDSYGLCSDRLDIMCALALPLKEIFSAHFLLLCVSSGNDATKEQTEWKETTKTWNIILLCFFLFCHHLISTLLPPGVRRRSTTNKLKFQSHIGEVKTTCCGTAWSMKCLFASFFIIKAYNTWQHQLAFIWLPKLLSFFYQHSTNDAIEISQTFSMTLVFASPRSCLKILATHVYRESNKHKIFLSFRRKFHRFSSVSLLFKATEECSKLHNTTSSSSSCCFCLPCVSWLPQVSSYQHQQHKPNDCSVVAVFDVGSEGKQWVKLFEKLFMLWLSDSQSHKEIIYTHSVTFFLFKDLTRARAA